MVLLNKFLNLIAKPVFAQSPTPNVSSQLPFQIPTLADVLAFAIKTFFIIAGLAALLYLLLGALAWVTSGGDKEAVQKAQQKIQSAVIGLIILVAALAIIVTIEQFVFGGKVCLGLTCPLKFDQLLKPNP